MPRKKIFLSLILSFLVWGGWALISPGGDTAAYSEHWLIQEEPDFCTDILVGRTASTDGSVMTVHTADCGMCDWTWHHIPATDNEPEAMRKIFWINQIRTYPPETGGKWGSDNMEKNFSGLEIPQVAHTYAYHHSVFGYMNEHQLAMAESTIGCQRKMRNNTPSAKMDITTLTMLAMERCRTAREAVQLMGSMGEKYGYGYHDSGEMLAVADAKEVWLFEIMPVGPLWTPESGKPGAVWCAQRVPDDHVSFCPNESRIGEVDIKNPDYFLASSNYKTLAVEMGLWDPDSGTPFSWKRAYSPSQGSALSSAGRRGRLWRLFDMAAPSRKFSPEMENMDFPFSVKPDHKLSPADVMSMTRDKYQGTMFDPASGIKGGPFANPNYMHTFRVGDNTYGAPRLISTNSVEYTSLTQCRDWLPAPIGGIVWVAFGVQDTSCYIPLYAGISSIPYSFTVGDHWVLNRDSARWAMDYVDYHTQVAYSAAIEDVKAAQERWENAALDRTPAIDTYAKQLYQKDPAQASAFLTDYCLSNADSVVKAWWELGTDLLVKYNHFSSYDRETRKRNSLEIPEAWKKAVVEYDRLEPAPQSKRPARKQPF
jgi:dipeptidase